MGPSYLLKFVFCVCLVPGVSVLAQAAPPPPSVTECKTTFPFDCEDPLAEGGDALCLYIDCVNGMCPAGSKEVSVREGTYNGIGPAAPGSVGHYSFFSDKLAVCHLSRPCSSYCSDGVGCDDPATNAPTTNAEVWVDYQPEAGTECAVPPEGGGVPLPIP